MKNYSLVLALGISALIVLSGGTCPSRVLENTVTQKDIATIVGHHNYLRSLIRLGKIKGQPKAKNLGDLKWDHALAREAQKIANTCVFAHRSVTDPRWWWVGQNLGWWASNRVSKGADWKGIIQAWFDEHKDFRYPNHSTGDTGHFTQVVWADTKTVGCGYTSYLKSGFHQKLYVCNYGPGGNVIGEAPYQT